jgi:hypothetical protein
MTNTVDLDALKAVLAKATPGEWEIYGEPEVGLPPSLFSCVIENKWPSLTPLEPLCRDDLAAIVTLHNAAPALIAEHERLVAEVARLRELLAEVQTPNMFWDPDNPETPLDCPTDGIELGGWCRETGVVYEVWQGRRMGSCYVAALPPHKADESDDGWEFIGSTPEAAQAAMADELTRRAALETSHEQP